MRWLSMDAIGIGIVMVMLASLMFALLMQQRQRSQKTIGVGIGSLVIGLLLGIALTLGILRVSGVRYLPGFTTELPMAGSSVPADVPASEDDVSGGTGDGASGGTGGPNPQRELTVLVRKLDLLTGDIKITLSADQCMSVAETLAGIEATEGLSDDEAQAKHDVLLAQLDEGQKTLLNAVGLPRPQRGGGGGAGGPAPAADANPFRQEANAEALARLRQQLDQ